MVAGEEQHKAGEEGVYRAKRWLESTTRFDLRWTVYGGSAQTTATLLDGSSVSYDVAGYLLDEGHQAGPRVFGEVKSYSNAGDQYAAYRKYLAVSYSASRQARGTEHDPAMEFMWVTTHPFSLGKYTVLCSAAEVETACTEHSGLLGEEGFDRGYAEMLAKRLWLLIVPLRVEEMMMSREFLGTIRAEATMAGS